MKVIIGEVTKVNKDVIQITIGKIIIEFEVKNNGLEEGQHVTVGQ